MQLLPKISLIPKTILIASLGCALSALMLTSAQAAPQPGVTIHPHVGYYGFDSKRNLDDDMLLGLGLGYQFDSPWAVEFNYLTGSADPEQGAGDVDFDQFRLDGLYHLMQSGKWQPYLAAGLGQAYFDTNASEDTETLINLGGGVKYLLTDNLSLRGDARLFNGFDDDTQDMALTLGLNYVFGSQRAPAPVTQAAPAGPADSDGDGVADSRDACPNTPAGTRVDARGCELDSDSDGVVDSRDACPNSAAGARVDERGCYITLTETKEIELKINFPNNSAEIDPSYLNEIKQVADFMKEYPQTDVVVEGHTDDRGAATYNQQLSESRAKAVADTLVSQFGVSAARVSSVGQGEADPIADNSTAEGRAANRRVVGVISAQVETRAQ